MTPEQTAAMAAEYKLCRERLMALADEAVSREKAMVMAREALSVVCREIRANTGAFEGDLRRVMGNTNYNILTSAEEQGRAAIATLESALKGDLTSSPPRKDGDFSEPLMQQPEIRDDV